MEDLIPKAFVFLFGLVIGTLANGRKWRGLVIVSFLGAALLYVLIGFSFVVIPPPRKALKYPKVFGVGLSRTGTTSLTLALNEYGYHSYHALPKLVSIDHRYMYYRHRNYSLARLNPYWSDSFDALTDIQASVVFEQLAKRYPDARFILNKREPIKWGKSMLKFCTEMRSSLEASQRLYNLGLWNLPVDGLFVAMYGDWKHHSAEDWTYIYNEHEKRVTQYFENEAKLQRRQNRLLSIDLTNSSDRTSFHRLGSFLGLKAKTSQIEEREFPRGDVMIHMFSTQILWQLQNAVLLFQSLWLKISLDISSVLSPFFFNKLD